MAASEVSLVNQRMSCVRVLLVELNRTKEESLLRTKALEDACLFSLICAYHHYLRELSARYNVPYFMGNLTLDAVMLAFESKNVFANEITELEALQSELNSWLNLIHKAYHQCWHPSDVKLAKYNSIIPSIDLGSTPIGSYTPPTLSNLNIWNEALNELITRHRETGIEC